MRAISRVVPVITAGAVGVGAGLGIGLLAASHGSLATPDGTAPLASPRPLSGAPRAPSSYAKPTATGPTSRYPST